MSCRLLSDERSLVFLLCFGFMFASQELEGWLAYKRELIIDHVYDVALLENTSNVYS